METNLLKQIFFDQQHHWDKFKQKHGRRIRPVVIKEVEKSKRCGDPKYGFKLLVCEFCRDIRAVPYRCKGRFCTTCSSGETEEWSRIMTEDVMQVNHRHVIFTIDEGLWPIFQKHREMLKGLMDEAAEIIQNWFEKKQKIKPGIIAGIHTFGAKLNFNPHVHMMVSMGGMKQTGEWKSYDFIPFAMMRKQWQTAVLKLIRRTVKEQEKQKIQPILQRAYQANGAGFYVHAPRQKGNIRAQLGYIGRYMRRPAIALHRIEEYDGQYVTYRYHDKKDGQEKREKITAEEFIGRIISHIAEEQFKTIRHYGVYGRRIKVLSKKLISAWQKEARRWIVKIKSIIKRRNWSERIKEQTGKDPLVCPACQNYYEYQGEVCLKQGELVVKYAVEKTARACMERMISHITGIKALQKRQEEAPKKEVENLGYRQLYMFGV
ncbi:MAG: transposase [Firmicutes bacterium]|nr:transposase [Bacillota bacterium]